LNVEKDAERTLAFLDRFGELASDASKPRFSARFFHYYRGCVFEDLENDETKARSEYEAALHGNWGVDLVPCADRLARIKAIHGERDGAIELWEKAMKLDPDNAAVCWNLSTAYRNAGEIEKSDALRKRLKASPDKRNP
jgi:tetratricopeptide (TPR) repeat protein